MKYTMGTPIPASEVLRRFKDEDGEMFLEVRGMENVLFRVTTGDRIYYKIDKDKLAGEELNLVVDYTKTRSDSSPSIDIPGLPLTDNPVISFDDFKDIAQTSMDEGDTLQFEKIPLKKQADIKEFNEGDIIPGSFRSGCIPNDYSGFTFRHEKFLYILDKNYCVDIKSQDSMLNYDLELDQAYAMEPAPPPSPTPKTITPMPPADLEIEHESEEKPIELEKGDILPFHLRRLCEAEIGSGFGSRIILGNYLYMMDSHYKVLQKMKISYIESEETPGFQEKIPHQKTKPFSSPAAPPPPSPSPKKIPPLEIVNTVVKEFDAALKKHKISADFFRESVLIPSHREILLKAFSGNLMELNDDTREATINGTLTIINESGFEFFKAVMVHELYIKSTLAGRGNNIKYFLSHILALKPDGTLGDLLSNIPSDPQKKMVDYFGERAEVYTDKTEMIKRIHRQVRSTIFEQYREIWLSKENVRFDAFLISKLYEHTTRLDRGDGITMIRLSRDIMLYEQNPPSTSK